MNDFSLLREGKVTQILRPMTAAHNPVFRFPAKWPLELSSAERAHRRLFYIVGKDREFDDGRLRVCRLRPFNRDWLLETSPTVKAGERMIILMDFTDENTFEAHAIVTQDPP